MQTLSLSREGGKKPTAGTTAASAAHLVSMSNCFRSLPAPVACLLPCSSAPRLCSLCRHSDDTRQ